MEPRGTPPGSPHGVRPLAAPFPPPGPPRRVPRLRRYYGAVRLPGSLSPRFVSFAWRYQALCLSFRSPQSRAPNRGPGVRQPVSRPANENAWRPSGSPKFLENPRVPTPCSSTPAGPAASGLTTRSARPPLCPRRRLPRQTQFRGSITRPWHSLSTLRGLGLPSLHARLASRCGPHSTGRDWLPAGFLRKVSDRCLPPFPGYRGARTCRILGLIKDRQRGVPTT